MGLIHDGPTSSFSGLDYLFIIKSMAKQNKEGIQMVKGLWSDNKVDIV